MKKNRWDPEIHIDVDLARSLIEVQFPALEIKKIISFGSGWDNAAFLVNDKYVFRFPHREVAVNAIEIEIKVLPIIENTLPLETPYLQFIGNQSDNFPWPFVGYRLLSGETACSLNLSDEVRGQQAIVLAKFLKALHSEEILNAAKKVNICGDVREKANPKYRVPFTKELFSKLVARNILSKENMTKSLEKLLEECWTLQIKEKPKLVHGDFYIRHLLIDDSNNASGVIDWGDAHIGHIGTDLSIVFAFLPKKFHDDFWKVYGEVSDETIFIAKLRALYTAVMLMDYGDTVNDHDLVREGYWTIKQMK